MTVRFNFGMALVWASLDRLEESENTVGPAS
jgi:hypothetical protein